MKTIRRRVQFKSDLPSRTQQQFKQECDVNSILERYRKTGMVTHISKQTQQYGDFTMYKDFQQSLNTVKDAFNAFENLPAHLRKRFANDPAKLLEFISDSKNYDEAKSLGILKVSENMPANNDDLTTKTQGKSKKETTKPDENASKE